MYASMIGRNMLEYQLRRTGIFGAEETICSHPNLDEKFKICTYITIFQVTHFRSINICGICIIYLFSFGTFFSYLDCFIGHQT